MVVILLLATLGASIPRADINKICESAKVGALPEDRVSALRGCIDDETAAMNQIKQDWNRFTTADRSNCAPTPAMEFSYVELLTCLEMQRGGGNLITASQMQHTPPLKPSSDKPRSDPSSPLATTAELPRAAPMPSVLVFCHDLALYSHDQGVKRLQIFLNGHGFPVAGDGPGSPGNEVETFGLATRVALEKFQKAHAKELGITNPSKQLGEVTRKYINNL